MADERTATGGSSLPRSPYALANQGGDVVGDRALRDQRLDLRGGAVERGGVIGPRLRSGGQDRLGELVLAHEAAIGERGDVEARRHRQARRRQTRERGALAADPLERGVGAVQFENERIGWSCSHVRFRSTSASCPRYLRSPAAADPNTSRRCTWYCRHSSANSERCWSIRSIMVAG